MREAVHESETEAPRASRLQSVVRSVLGWALLAAALWLVWPSTLGGCTTLTVVSGHSMEPTYYTGDLVISRCGAPKVGDVVVYRPEEVGGSARIIHRIVGGNGTTGWTMKGDNNDFVDPFVPKNADVVGVALVHVPEVGRVSVVLLNPWVWAALILAAAVLLIWPSSEQDDEGVEALGHTPSPDEAVTDAPLVVPGSGGPAGPDQHLLTVGTTRGQS